MQSQDAIDKAKRNLKNFSVIGMVDDMAPFQRRLRQVLGVRVRIGHLNKPIVTGKDLESAVTAQVLRKVDTPH